MISIHAPTRGATPGKEWVLRKGDISIHAPTRGATPFFQSEKVLLGFQSTLPREERRHATRILDTHRAFQSTLPREERPEDCSECVSYSSCISIHAPTRGATAILHKKFVYFYTIPTINI